MLAVLLYLKWCKYFWVWKSLIWNDYISTIDRPIKRACLLNVRRFAFFLKWIEKVVVEVLWNLIEERLFCVILGNKGTWRLKRAYIGFRIYHLVYLIQRALVKGKWVILWKSLFRVRRGLKGNLWEGDYFHLFEKLLYFTFTLREQFSSDTKWYITA